MFKVMPTPDLVESPVVQYSSEARFLWHGLNTHLFSQESGLFLCRRAVGTGLLAASYMVRE